MAISASPASGLAGGTTNFNISIASAGGAQPAAVQWTVGYSTADISSLSVAAAGTAASAAKTVSCSNGTGAITCMIYGMTPTVISDGIVAQVTVNLSPTSTASSTAIQLTAASASDKSGNPINATATGSQIALQPAPAQLTSLACSPATITISGNTSCTVSLSGPASAAGFPVALSSNNTGLTVPASVTVPAGATTASFSASAASIKTNQSAVITASANAVTQSATISLNAAPAPAQLTSLSCAPAMVASGNSATCTVSLSAAAPSTGAAVTLSGGTAALSIPSGVTIAAGATSATFTAAASGTTTQTVPLTASWNGVSVSFSETVLPTAATLSILGNPSELKGLTNGSVITPTIAPPGLTGTVVANAPGSVNFAPDQSGNGVYFLNCCSNSGNAYYKFTGAAVGSIFNFTQGQISFSLTSRANMAQRTQFTSNRTVFDVRDGNASNHLVSFNTQVMSGNLIFYYTVGGVSQYYYVPTGTENTLFGSGVAMQVAIAWTGNTLNLYLNGNLVNSSPYAPSVPNWTAASVFDLGAYEYQNFGGYDSSDDVIGEFMVTSGAASLPPTPPVTPSPAVSSLQCTPASVNGGASSACTVTLSSAAPSTGAAVAISSNNTSITVPASVAVPAGATSASFSASTTAVTATQTGSITASYGGTTQSASITVAPSPAPSVQCTPASVNGGASSACTVTLSSAAPAAGATVAISVNNTAVTVPASVAVPAGATSASFSASTTPVAASQTAAITVSYGGASRSASITVVPPAVSTLSCAPASVSAGSSTSCTIKLSSAAPSTGATVAISATNSAAKVPASAAVPAGATSTTFSVATTSVTANQMAVITISYGGASRMATITIVPPALSSLQCAPSSVSGGSSAACTVTLSGTAPTGGLAVSLSANNPMVTVPAAMTIPAGATSGTFAAATSVVTTTHTVSVAATAAGASQTATLNVTAPTPSSLACTPTTLAAGSAVTCTISLSAPAPAGGLPVALVSNNASLTVPASIIVPAGSTTVSFSANTAPVTADQPAAITASANTVTQSAAVSLLAPTQLTSLSCNPAKVPSGSTATCTVTLTKAAPAGGAAVTLSGGTAVLSIPAAVTIAAGATSATFTATGSATTTQTMPLTASWNGVFVSFTVTALGPQPVLSILGNPSELSGLTNGSIVTPTAAPAGLTGTVVVNGGGSVDFAPNQNGNGVYFLSCCTNSSNAYYKFTGAAVGSIFNFQQGQIAFGLTSRSSMAQRATAASYRSVVDVRDGNASNHLVSFTTQVTSGSLVFFYSVGGQVQYYYVPKGTENTLFGSGVTMQVAITWSGSTLDLYLNGTLVKSTPYTPPTPNWTSASVFDLGAYEYQAFGGYDSCDDVISEFSVGPVTQH